MYKFEKNTTPLYIQLYEQIKDEIKTKLKPGSKLPSIRKMSNEYNLSKNTIQSAYNQLYAEGYIESISNSGYYVSQDLYDMFKSPIKYSNNTPQNNTFVKYDFYPARLDKDSFPKKTWQRLYNKVLKEDIDYGMYYSKQGLPELRAQISKYLAEKRGVNSQPNQVVITSGFSSSMTIIALLSKTHTNTLSIEYPGYITAKKVFQNLGFEIQNIPLTKNGIDLNELKKQKSKLVYTTPSHQYPTGITIPIANRIKLINWAIKEDSYIIEDDYDTELSYYNQPIPAMQGINNNDKVIYIGTFSKSLSPSLRITYLVLPKSLVTKYKEMFDFSFSGVSMDLQKTLTLFIKEGHWDKHLRKIRILNKKKHDILKTALQKYLKDIKILRHGSGLSILVYPNQKINFEVLVNKCLENGIKLYTVELVDNTKGLFMGYGSFKEEDIEDGVKAFAKIYTNLIPS